MVKKLLLETTAPFQGLPELVAFNEGLFEKEGLDVWVRWDSSHGEPVELRCPHCGHVSGELTPGYVSREEHRPNWEHEHSSP